MRSSWLFSCLSALMALVSLPTPAAASSFDTAKMHKVRYNGIKQGMDGDLAERGPTLVELDKRAFNFGTNKVRGVNIGGWLVTEPFITPSLYAATGDDRVVDEWTFGLYVPDAATRLQNHWATWITEDDFLGWAQKYGLKVLIDLHGAPGSQNGFDNSGQRLDGNAIGWNKNSTNAARAKQAIVAISKLFAADQYKDTVVAIELLNEPAAYKDPNLLSFYIKWTQDAYYGMNLSYWGGQFTPPKFNNVLLSTHRYTQCQSNRILRDGRNAWSQERRMQYFCNLRTELRNSSRNLWTLVDEFTTAPNDCAQWLNGRGRGARYEGQLEGEPFTGLCFDKTFDASRFSDSYKAYLKAMFDTQTKLYEETTSGWIMWAWKMESAPEWSFKSGLQYGWIPQGSLGARSSAYC
ncbi:hypothetical protein V8E36_005991 [Tilletia maclaganii]